MRDGGVLARAAMAWQCADADMSDRVRTTFVLSGPRRLFVDCCDGISLTGQAREMCAAQSARSSVRRGMRGYYIDTTAYLHLNPA